MTVDAKKPLPFNPERQNSNTSGAFIDHDTPPRQDGIRVVEFGESPDTPKYFGEHRNIAAMQLDTMPYSFCGDNTNLEEYQENSWWKFLKGPCGGFPSPLPYGYEKEPGRNRILAR